MHIFSYHGCRWPTRLGKIKPLAKNLALFVGLLIGANQVHASVVNVQATQRDGNVLRTTLDNGLHVVIVHDALAPVVTTQVTYLAGSYDTPLGFPGTAHALEHMMFRDSMDLTGAQLDEMTGKMGGSINAFTANDATQFYIIAPSAYLDILLRIESTRMRGALLTDKDWGLEKGAIEQEVSRKISDPGFLADEYIERLLFTGTGYAEDPLGTRPSFDKTNSNILRSFYDRLYAPNNAIVVIVGDVDTQTTLAKVKQLFGPIPRHVIPKRAPIQLQPMQPQTIRMTTPQGTGSVQFAYRMPGMRTKDYAAAEILIDAINNARSDLSELAVQGKVLSANAQMQPFSQGGIGVVEAGFPKGGNSEQVRQHLDDVLSRLLKNGVPQELVETAKSAELAQAEFNKNSAVTLASAWSQALAWQGLDSPEQADQQIRNVTVDDVNRVARTYLQPDERVIAILTPDENGKRPPNSGGFGGSESFTGDERLDTALPDWAAKSLNALAVPHWTLAPIEMKLDNGIRLIVQPETVSKTVTVVGYIDHDYGLQEPKGQEGVGRLLSTLFDYGSTNLNRNAFHRALDKIDAYENAGLDFYLAVPSDHFDRGMQLLADNELHPALPQQGFDVQRSALAQTLAGEMQSPKYKIARVLKQGLLPGNDPELREATPASVYGLTITDVKDYFAVSYRSDLTTLVVVGDVTPEQAKATVEKYFGDWKASGAKPDVISKPVPANSPSYTVVNNPYASQDLVLLGQVLDINLYNPDRYALQLGNDVLGGNGFASHLMADIRMHHGYAYGAGSVMRFERSRSIFYVQYGSDPDKVAFVDGLVQKNLSAMQNITVSADDLNNARQYEIRSIPLGVSSVERIAQSLLKWAYQGQPLDEPIVAAKHYLELTPVQVQDAFKKYLMPHHMVQIVQGPQPTRH